MSINIKFLIGLIITIFVFSNFSVEIYAEENEGKIKLSNGVVWVKASEEYKLCVQQAYADASESLKELARDEEPGKWCVVIDIDDTMLSTVKYVEEYEASGTDYSDETWNSWYEKDEATPLPGAVEFTWLVKELGGKVVLITNTKYPLRQAALDKLDTFGFYYDICLMREGPYKDDKTKVERRKDILCGTIKGYTEYENVPPLKIVMKVGDAVHDLYDPSVYSFEDVKDRIGKSLIIIPNPLYGTWTESPEAFVPALMDLSDIPVKVNGGEEFTIKLDCKQAGGCKWHLAAPLDESMLKLISSNYEENKEIWVFKALKAGKTMISFSYSGECGDTAPVETREFFIIIK